MMTQTAARIAVIGAGMAGLASARALVDRGLSVTVMDKGRGLGGRMATRRAEGGFQFDHGVQYVTARDEAFAALLAEARASGAVARWPRDGDTAAHVGLPGMTGLARHLAAGLDIRQQTRIDRIARVDDRWHLTGPDGVSVFDRVALTVPAPQIADLLAQDDALARAVDAVRMDPCLTLMLGLRRGFALPFTTRRAPDQDISWIACDSAKPGRPDMTCVVAQAAPGWSLRHLELPVEQIAAHMLPLVCAAIGADPASDPLHVAAHRWRYAFVATPLGQPFLTDAGQSLFAGGDWCLGPRVQDAWTSGRAMAQALADSL